jgi:hypothetical protein
MTLSDPVGSSVIFVSLVVPYILEWDLLQPFQTLETSPSSLINDKGSNLVKAETRLVFSKGQMIPSRLDSNGFAPSDDWRASDYPPDPERSVLDTRAYFLALGATCVKSAT